MITTELVSADDPTAVPILRAAQELSIAFLKPGYYHYKFIDVRKELAQAGNHFRGLVELAEKYEVQVGSHNHAGYVGGQVWDMVSVMDTLNPKGAGDYYDLENATAEGGAEGWRINAHLVMPRMIMMAAKDFYNIGKKPRREVGGKRVTLSVKECFTTRISWGSQRTGVSTARSLFMSSTRSRACPTTRESPLRERMTKPSWPQPSVISTF